MNAVAIIVGALILAGWLYWLTARVQLVLSHVEDVVDKADQSVTNSEAVIHHLAETELPGSGRHQLPSSARPSPSPRPAVRPPLPLPSSQSATSRRSPA